MSGNNLRAGCCCCLDPVEIVGDAFSSKTEWKLSSLGNLCTDSYNTTVGWGIILDSAGLVVFAGNRVSSKSVWKLNSSGGLVWS